MFGSALDDRRDDRRMTCTDDLALDDLHSVDPMRPVWFSKGSEQMYLAFAAKQGVFAQGSGLKKRVEHIKPMVVGVPGLC